MKIARWLAGLPFTAFGWLLFGIGWAFWISASVLFQLGGDIANEPDDL